MSTEFRVDYQYIEVEYMCPYNNGAARAFRVELHMRLDNGAWTTRQTVIPVPWDAPWCVVGRLAHDAMCMPSNRSFPWCDEADDDTQVYKKDSDEVIYDSSLRDEAMRWEDNYYA